MWPPKTILHPTDFSECSQQAFELACDLAAQSHGKVIVLHAPAATIVPSEFPVSLVYEDEEEARQKLAALLPFSPDVTVEHRLISGPPNDVIVRAAREIRPDLIVMGTHGRRGFSRLLLGSVAEHVVRAADCPVLLAKSQPGKKASRHVVKTSAEVLIGT